MRNAVARANDGDGGGDDDDDDAVGTAPSGAGPAAAAAAAAALVSLLVDGTRRCWLPEARVRAAGEGGKAMPAATGPHSRVGASPVVCHATGRCAREVLPMAGLTPRRVGLLQPPSEAVLQRGEMEAYLPHNVLWCRRSECRASAWAPKSTSPLSSSPSYACPSVVLKPRRRRVSSSRCALCPSTGTTRQT
eukprot:scaffold2033_cov367-Prasinococcus_capsulatus_cf.AAC.5